MTDFNLSQGYSLAEQRGYVRVRPPLEDEALSALTGLAISGAQVDGFMPRTDTTDLNFYARDRQAAIALSVLVKDTLIAQGNTVLQAEGMRPLAPYQLYIRGSSPYDI